MSDNTHTNTKQDGAAAAASATPAPAAVASSTPAAPAATASAASSSVASSSAASASPPPPPPSVDSFLRDLSVLERSAELSRVLSSFALNPLDVLNLPSSATPSDISKAYRTISLQVHPDKFPDGDEREKAQKAFTKLGAAREELQDGAKREQLDLVIDQARQRLLTRHAAEAQAQKKRRTEEGSSSSSSSAGASSSDDPTTHPLFETWLRAEVKEILIEREWRKRQLLKAAATEEKLAAEAKAQRQADKEAREAAEKEWEDTREERINSWRNFQKGAKGKGKKARPLVARTKAPNVDEQNTFVRRPAPRDTEKDW